MGIFRSQGHSVQQGSPIKFSAKCNASANVKLLYFQKNLCELSVKINDFQKLEILFNKILLPFQNLNA